MYARAKAAYTAMGKATITTATALIDNAKTVTGRGKTALSSDRSTMRPMSKKRTYHERGLKSATMGMSGGTGKTSAAAFRRRKGEPFAPGPSRRFAGSVVTVLQRFDR